MNFKEKSYAQTIIILGGIGLIFTLALGQRVLLSTRLKRSLNQWDQQKTALKQEQRQKYNQLLAKQEKQLDQRQKELAKNIEQQSKTALIGDKTLYLIMAKPNGYDDSLFQPLLKNLKSSKEHVSLDYLKVFTEAELARHSSQNLNLKIELIEPIQALTDLTKVGDMANHWEKDPFATSLLQDEFQQVLDQTDLKLDQNHKAIFLYFDPHLANNGSNRFYDSKKFRSFADENKNVAYINVYRFEPDFASRLSEIILHEYLHLYGAKDKYLETEIGCKAEGKGDLNLPPIAPQEKADIMCGLIQDGYEDYTYASLDDENLTINQATAKEIGWLDD